jgi:hypothetical protein
MHVYRYLTYDNVLVWRILKDISSMFKGILPEKLVNELPTQADRVEEAILTHCIKTENGKRIFCWSTDLNGHYDIYDEPEQVHALMSKCAGAAIWLEKELRSIAGTVEGGTVTANMWFPGAAPYLSEDFTDLCSAASYRDIGMRHTQRILDEFGGAYIHHHGKGYHVHSEIARLRNLKTLEISLDPNGPKPVEHLDELFDLNGGVPLMIRCAAQDVYRHIDSMKKGRLVIMLNIDNLEEGRDVVKFIRRHSK